MFKPSISSAVDNPNTYVGKSIDNRCRLYSLLQAASHKISLKGNHGFDNTNDDMKTTFLARGPNFKCGYKQEEMRSVDLYPLLCNVLDLSTCHESRGDLQKTQGLLTSDYCIPSSSTAHSASASALALLCVAWLAL